jgi:hypothetical protein
MAGAKVTRNRLVGQMPVIGTYLLWLSNRLSNVSFVRIADNAGSIGSCNLMKSSVRSALPALGVRTECR